MMMSGSTQGAFRNIREYPQNLLRMGDGSVQVPVTYKKVWDDGFGARGWKVDATIGDPEIIASTRAVSYTHLRAHETKTRISFGGV